MAFTPSSLLAFLSSFLFLFSLTTAFDITKILSNYPDFSTFSNYLTKTKLTTSINSRSTITVLVVDDGAASQLSQYSMQVQSKLLSVHVVLDYYDLARLQKLKNKSAILTTLFQSSGLARGQQGFLNATVMGNNQVAFGSAVQGSGLNSQFVKTVFTQPYNISVLQVSSLIIPTGVSLDDQSPSSSPVKSPPSPAPTPSKSKKSPTASPPKGDGSPSPSDSNPTADGPSADSPAADDSSAYALAPASFGIVSVVFMMILSSLGAWLR